MYTFSHLHIQKGKGRAADCCSPVWAWDVCLREEWESLLAPGWCCLDPHHLEEALRHLAHVWTPTFRDVNWNLYSQGLKLALGVLAAGQWGHEERRLTGTTAPLARCTLFTVTWHLTCWHQGFRLGWPWPCGGKELSGRWHRNDGNTCISPFLCPLPHLAGDHTAQEGKDAFGTWCSVSRIRRCSSCFHEHRELGVLGRCWRAGEKPAMWEKRCKATFTLRSKVSKEVK